jgi:uncharacterized protein (TIGR03437 family)
MIQGKLQQGFDMGVNSSGNKTDWLLPDGDSLKMAYPSDQAWGAVFVTVGRPVDTNRPGMDFSSFATLLVEIKGDPGQTFDIGIKDKDQPDNGNESKVTVVLTSNWRVYAIPLTRFSGAKLDRIYVPTEFVFGGVNAVTAWVRNIAYTTSAAPAIDAVVSAASFQPGLAVGSWVTVTGKNLSPASTRGWNSGDFPSSKLPTALDGVAVSINDRNMAPSYISPTQINFLAFSDVPAGSAFVAVTNAVGTSAPVPVNVKEGFPALFVFGPSYNYVAAVHTDGTIVGKAGLFGSGVGSQPARPGEIISLFGTGCGPTIPVPPPDEVLTTAVPLRDIGQLRVRIANITADVQFAGLSGVGLCQYNIVVPNVADGDQPIVIDHGGITSQSGVFVTIQR